MAFKADHNDTRYPIALVATSVLFWVSYHAFPGSELWSLSAALVYLGAIGILGTWRITSYGFPRLAGLIAPMLLAPMLFAQYLFPPIRGFSPLDMSTISGIGFLVATGIIPSSGPSSARSRIPGKLSLAIAGTGILMPALIFLPARLMENFPLHVRSSYAPPENELFAQDGDWYVMPYHMELLSYALPYCYWLLFISFMTTTGVACILGYKRRNQVFMEPVQDVNSLYSNIAVRSARIPWPSLVMIAFLIALTILWISIDGYSLITNRAGVPFTTAFVRTLPATTLLYLVPMVAGYIWRKDRSRIAAIAMVVALLPFVHWGYSKLGYVPPMDHVREESERMSCVPDNPELSDFPALYQGGWLLKGQLSFYIECSPVGF